MTQIITPAQAKYIDALCTKLGYAKTFDMWREYGYVEQTMGGERPRTVSKNAASDVINRLNTRVAELAGQS